jgi:hypothetical protein
MIFIIMGVRYREIWEKTHGEIPIDEFGRTYDIHHIDGNRNNNNIENLICLSIEDHYKLHLSQSKDGNIKDLASVRLLSYRLNKKVDDLKGWEPSEETKEKIRKKLIGKKRPDDVIKKVSQSLKNYKWSEEQIKKRADGIKKFYDNATEEWKNNRNEKISKGRMGIHLSNKTKEKLSKYNSKLKDDEVLLIMDLIISGEKYKIISEKFNISPAQITSIKQKKTYKWLWN